MSVTYRRAGFLLYAAVQFLVLTAVAMVLYAGGNTVDHEAASYAFFGNFFSDLGTTTTWWGRSNTASAVLFVAALGTIGVGFVRFAPAWREIAFDRGKARAVGVAAQVCGTLSGVAFVGIAATPANLVLRVHNSFVLAAFGLLLAYVVCLNVLWWRNGASRITLAVSALYLGVVAVYAVVVFGGAGAAEWTPEMMQRQIAAQKAVVYASMAFVIFLTLATRKKLVAMR